MRKFRELPFVRSAKLGEKDDTPLIILETSHHKLQAKTETHRIRPELARTHLSYAVVDKILAVSSAFSDHRSILLAPYVAAPLAHYLASKGVNFLDLAGNCRIVLGEHFLVSIEGRRPQKTKRDRGIRAAGYGVMLALLADPSLLARPVREIARQAEVSKSAVSDIFTRLKDEGFIVGKRRKELVRRHELLSRILVGYADVLRPRLLVGRYRTQEAAPEQIESAIEEILGRKPDWGWGGVSAGRRLGLAYSGPEVAVHVDRPHSEIEQLPHQLRAVESRSGSVVILRMPGPVFRSAREDRIVHPLLVYLELMTSGNERAREAATSFQQQLVGLT